MMPSSQSRAFFLGLVAEGYSVRHAAELTAVQFAGEVAWAKDGAAWSFCENTAFACALSAAIAEAGRRPKLSVIGGAAEHAAAERDAGGPGFTPRQADEWLTCTEAARVLGLHRRTVQNQARDYHEGRLARVDSRIAGARRTPGGHWRVRLAS